MASLRNENLNENIEIVVIGGGPNGLMFANESKQNILVIEKYAKYQRTQRVRLDLNVVANPAIRTSLEQLIEKGDATRKDEHYIIIPIQTLEECFLQHTKEKNIPIRIQQFITSLQFKELLKEHKVNDQKELEVKLKQEFIVDVEQIHQQYPNCKLIIGADGSRSSVRELVTQDALSKTDFRHMIEVKYEVKGKAHTLSSLNLSLTQALLDGYLCSEHVKYDEEKNRSTITLSFIVDKDTYNDPMLNGVNAKNLLQFRNDNIPSALKNAINMWVKARGDKDIIMASPTINKTILSIYTSNTFTKEVNHIPVLLLGDAACGFPFMNGLIIGIKNAVALAALINKNWNAIKAEKHEAIQALIEEHIKNTRIVYDEGLKKVLHADNKISQQQNLVSAMHYSSYATVKLIQHIKSDEHDIFFGYDPIRFSVLESFIKKHANKPKGKIALSLSSALQNAEMQFEKIYQSLYKSYLENVSLEPEELESSFSFISSISKKPKPKTETKYSHHDLFIPENSDLEGASKKLHAIIRSIYQRVKEYEMELQNKNKLPKSHPVLELKNENNNNDKKLTIFFSGTGMNWEESALFLELNAKKRHNLNDEKAKHYYYFFDGAAAATSPEHLPTKTLEFDATKPDFVKTSAKPDESHFKHIVSFARGDGVDNIILIGFYLIEWAIKQGINQFDLVGFSRGGIIALAEGAQINQLNLSPEQAAKINFNIIAIDPVIGQENSKLVFEPLSPLVNNCIVGLATNESLPFFEPQNIIKFNSVKTKYIRLPFPDDHLMCNLWMQSIIHSYLPKLSELREPCNAEYLIDRRVPGISDLKWDNNKFGETSAYRMVCYYQDSRGKDAQNRYQRSIMPADEKSKIDFNKGIEQCFQHIEVQRKQFNFYHTSLQNDADNKLLNREYKKINLGGALILTKGAQQVAAFFGNNRGVKKDLSSYTNRIFINILHEAMFQQKYPNLHQFLLTWDVNYLEDAIKEYGSIQLENTKKYVNKALTKGIQLKPLSGLKKATNVKTYSDVLSVAANLEDTMKLTSDNKIELKAEDKLKAADKVDLKSAAELGVQNKKLTLSANCFAQILLRTPTQEALVLVKRWRDKFLVTNEDWAMLHHVYKKNNIIVPANFDSPLAVAVEKQDKAKQKTATKKGLGFLFAGTTMVVAKSILEATENKVAVVKK